MMTEENKQKITRETLERKIGLYEETIAKAEKYERLKENKDWQGFLEDLRKLIELHDKEIKMGTMMLADSPNNGYVKIENLKQAYVSSKEDWTDFLVRHQIQRQELQHWVEEPDRILTLAGLARNGLPALKDQLKELVHAPAAVGNGKE
jgi:hypothetical protein